MNIHRFFIAPEFIDEEKGIIVCRSDKLVRQVRKVLRLENGQEIAVLNGQGNIYHCILANILPAAGRDVFQARIISQEKNSAAPTTTFTLAMPLIKASRFEWALEKLTELGVDIIVPIILDRTVVKIPKDTYASGTSHDDRVQIDNPKLSRWHKIIEEAVEQCERPLISELSTPLSFTHWLNVYDQSKHHDSTIRLICAERRCVQTLQTSLDNWRRKNAMPTDCAIAVGAEGGFSDKEIQFAEDKGFIPVSLGPNILRSETAAVYALSISKAILCHSSSASSQFHLHP